ncbi:MAG: O-antigen ligase family protein [Thermoleophilia bacterium]
MRGAVALRAAGVSSLWLVAGLVVGAVNIMIAYRLGPIPAVALPLGLVYVYFTHLDFRVGLLGLLLAMGVGESVGINLGFFTLSPFKIALAVLLVLVAVRELVTKPQSGFSLAATKFSGLEVAASLFGVSLIASSIVASDHVSVLKETTITLLAVMLFMTTRRLLRKLDDVRYALWGIVVFGSIISAQAVVGYVGGQRAASDLSSVTELRVGSVLGHPNQLAGLLVLILPVALALLLWERRFAPRLVVACAVSVVGLGLLFTLSRTGWLAAIVGLLVAALLARGRVLLWVLAFLAVLAIAVSAAGATGALEERARSTTNLGQFEVSSRLEFWSASLKMAEQSPVVGVGLANYPEAYADLNLQGKWYLPGPGFRPPPHAHNLVLTLLAETGLLGISAFFGLLISILVTALRAHRLADPHTRLLVAGLVGALVAYAVENVADVTFFQNVTQTTFWVEIGCLAALVDILRDRGPTGSDGLADATGSSR